MKSLTILPEQITEETIDQGEWLVTNGIGGYACGSIGGALRRKYHALLNASLPAPFGRTVMLNYVQDSLVFPDKTVPISYTHMQGHMQGEPMRQQHYLVEFRLENGIPFWKYQVDGVVFEKHLFLIHRQNTLVVSYRIAVCKEPIALEWRPYFHFRVSEAPVNAAIAHEAYNVHATDFKYEITCPGFPSLRIFTEPVAPFTIDTQTLKGVYYELEAKRGYESVGDLTSPGFFSFPMKEGDKIHCVVSTEDWQTILSLTPQEAMLIEKLRKRNLLKMAHAAMANSGVATARSDSFAKLVLAADQFVIAPTTRHQDMVRLQAAGEEIRSVIAGFPWFTDWGRDTMITLEGLTLCTGRHREAHAILQTFSHYIREGLIPNMFPDGELQGVYNTADATLWFFHAIDRYTEVTGDDDIIDLLLPKLKEIIYWHLQGTHFGIRADKDGLLIQGCEGFQLTWMDAKVGDWVVTPRRGKAVEINGLWYNALRLYEAWTGKALEVTDLCYDSFNQKFWYEEGKYLFDVVEGEKGNDAALRPNQLFAISLKYPVLKKDRWKMVLDKVEGDLLTPFGLRTLSPSHPDYRACYDGDLRSRDAAYHQGTVWPWLIGPYIDVFLKVYPREFSRARALLDGLEKHLQHNCMGTIGEIFDACAPYHARGCFAQAWSVAELIRTLVKVSK